MTSSYIEPVWNQTRSVLRGPIARLKDRGMTNTVLESTPPGG